MSATDKITIEITGHGQYQTSAEALGMMMARYLPSSVEKLRAIIAEEHGAGCEGHYDTDEALLSGVGIGEPVYCDGTCVTNYRDLQTVTECLMILAELRGYATN